MKTPPPAPAAEKAVLHPRNRHRARYDFAALAASSPELAAFVHANAYGDASVDFANPAAVKALNRALLRHFYGIAHWDIPAGYLCPPIPGRADYLHYVADLLASTNGGEVPRGAGVRVLDIGVGANCIYPIIGHQEYGWQFVGSDIDPVALRAAQQNVAANPALHGAIVCRLQPEPTQLLGGIVQPGERFDAVVCNPPFHASAAAAAAGTQLKISNLGGRAGSRSSGRRGAAPVLNFGGQPAELWCPGGEEVFVRRLVQESARQPLVSRWFTTLIAKKDTLRPIYHALKLAGATEVRTVAMAQGQKKSRFVAWTFCPPAPPENRPAL